MKKWQFPEERQSFGVKGPLNREVLGFVAFGLEGQGLLPVSTFSSGLE